MWHPGWVDSCGMAQCRRSWGRCQVGNAALWAGEDGRAGLVRTGEREKAIRFLQETRSLSRAEAMKRVEEVAAELGMR